MLVLSRKHGQRLLVGESMVVTLVSVRGKHVRLSSEAPPEIHIVRQELDAWPSGSEDSHDPIMIRDHRDETASFHARSRLSRNKTNGGS